MYILKSYAKINLFLRVVNKMTNGYHNLETLMSYIDLHDIITIRTNTKSTPGLYITGPFARCMNQFSSKELNNNTVSRAIKMMHQKYKTPIDFDIVIHKNIPVGAGLGGGSGNAATVINFINDHYNLKLKPKELFEIGAQIGADVPFFLQNKMALCEGIGEKITPIDYNQVLNNFPILLIKPHSPMLTKHVFARHRAPQKGNSHPTVTDLKNKLQNGEYITANDIFDASNIVDNDLALSAIHFNHEIASILFAIRQDEEVVVANMSGSGPTCFAICKNLNTINRLAYQIKKQHPFAFMFTTNLLQDFRRSQVNISSYPCFIREASVMEDYA